MILLSIMFTDLLGIKFLKRYKTLFVHPISYERRRSHVLSKWAPFLLYQQLRRIHLAANERLIPLSATNEQRPQMRDFASRNGCSHKKQINLLGFKHSMVYTQVTSPEKEFFSRMRENKNPLLVYKKRVKCSSSYLSSSNENL